MKKTIVLSIIISFTLFGCMTAMYGTSYKYDYGLVNTEVGKSLVDSSSLAFSDDKIDVDFTINAKSVGFTMKNKTDQVLKIIWDEASMVQYGKSMKVMHSGIKYVDRNGVQPPTVIPPQTLIDDIVLPSENVSYTSGYYGKYYSSPGGWTEHDLFPLSDFNKEDIRTAILSSKGQKFSIYLPIQYMGKTLDYMFNFIITDVRPLTPMKPISSAKKQDDPIY